MANKMVSKAANSELHNKNKIWKESSYSLAYNSQVPG